MEYATATQLVAALRARQVSSVELVEQSIARIESLDPRINAVVVRDFERARAAAAEADRALARGEQPALMGVPITVKESFDVAGLPTTWGIPGTAQRAVADAVVVRRLKQAGAVLLGKTNVAAMLADWQTANPVYGVTNNPWDAGRTPGGSSGGSAATLAAGFVPLEFGSDLAGSLRVPAHCCGVFAHKPTHGIVPLRGHAPPGTPALSVGVDVDLAVVGPMALCADDLQLALDVTAGPDDAQAAAYRLELPPPRHAELRDYRVLVLDAHPLLPTSNAVRAALERIADGLARAGCTVARSTPLLPDLAFVARTWGALMAAFIGADLPADEYARIAAAAPGMQRDESTAFARGMVASHRDWIHADRQRAGVAHQWRLLFERFDVLLCPVLPVTAIAHDHRPMDERRIDVDGRAVRYTEQALWASVATLSGLPATAVPIGASADDGLPIGMQIVGPTLEDRTTIGFARLVEREFGGFVAPRGARSVIQG